MEVEYRTIERFPGYRFGSDGSVWSCWIGNGKHRRRGEAWFRFSPFKLPFGYLQVWLANEEGRKKYSVHRLILEAFCGPCPMGHVACHFPDKNPENNRIDNLRWDTTKGNYNDRRVHQTDFIGERHPRAKLNTVSIQQIRESRAAGVPRILVAAKFGLNKHTVTAITKRRAWKHV